MQCAQIVVVEKATRREDIARLVAMAEPRIQRAFREVIRRVNDAHKLGELVELLERGRVDLALDVVREHARLLADSVLETYIAAGQEAALVVDAAIPGTVRFDLVNDRAILRMRNRSLGLIREFSDEQRRATYEALTDGVQRGLNPRAMARQYRASIGLTKYQIELVNNYRLSLERLSGDALGRELRDRRYDRTVARAIESGQPLTRTQIDTMVERYRQRWVKFRSETIARSEALPTAHEGSLDMWRQARENGALEGLIPERSWTPGPATVHAREQHQAMRGQKVGLDEPFTAPDGTQLLYPGDPAAPARHRIRCRCAVATRLRRAGDTQQI